MRAALPSQNGDSPVEQTLDSVYLGFVAQRGLKPGAALLRSAGYIVPWPKFRVIMLVKKYCTDWGTARGALRFPKQLRPGESNPS